MFSVNRSMESVGEHYMERTTGRPRMACPVPNTRGSEASHGLSKQPLAYRTCSGDCSWHPNLLEAVILWRTRGMNTPASSSRYKDHRFPVGPGVAKVKVMAKEPLGHDANGLAARISRALSLCGAFRCTERVAELCRRVPPGSSDPRKVHGGHV
jgi:hypothetical protein